MRAHFVSVDADGIVRRKSSCPAHAVELLHDIPGLTRHRLAHPGGVVIDETNINQLVLFEEEPHEPA